MGGVSSYNEGEGRVLPSPWIGTDHPLIGTLSTQQSKMVQSIAHQAILE